jgi:TPR repeat protein
MKAQYSLGVMHHTGRTPQLSATQADAAAFKHMKLAAEQVCLTSNSCERDRDFASNETNGHLGVNTNTH